MEIFINDKPVDFRLEGETTFGGVFEALGAWLQKEGYICSAVRLNGHAVDPAEEPSETPVAEIERIDVDVVKIGDLPKELLTTLHQYLSLVARTLERPSDSTEAPPNAAAREALAEYAYVRTSLEHFLMDILGEPGRAHFERLDTALAALADRPDPASAIDDATKEALEQTISLCEARRHELENPERELAAVMGLVHGMLDSVRDVPVQLQTGKNPEAMQTVVRFTELTAKMLRLLPTVPNLRTLVVDEAPVDEHIQGLNQILNELTEAFAAEDAILVGDLLEYEIVERIEALIGAVQNQP